MTERRSKYNARPVDLDGYHFDSQAEASRYNVLKLCVQAGEIKNLIVHPRYELQPAFTYGDQKHRAIYYEGDFQYREIATDNLVIEDVKGVETEVFKLKMKLFLHQYPGIDFRIIRTK
jgi:hypothetical protein